MSIAYQSWEIGSGPTVGYKLQPHQTAGDGLNFRKLIYRAPTPAPAPVSEPTLPPGASRTLTGSTSSSPKLMNLQGSSNPSPASSPRARFEEPFINNNSSNNNNNRFTGSNTSSSSSVEIQQDDGASSSIVTSSISTESSDDDEKEVQSAFKGPGPLEQMDTLMTTLPIRRSLSKFYTGKSRSFTSLADVKSMSMKDLAKPDNPYTKKRRAPSHHREDKPRFPPPRVSNGIAKKPISSTGTTLTLAVAMSTRAEGNEGENCSVASGNRWQKSCRSFSLTDLQKA